VFVQKRNEKKLEIFKRAEKYTREYSIKEREKIRLARQARKHGNFYVPPAPKLAFVMRIRGYSIVNFFQKQFLANVNSLLCSLYATARRRLANCLSSVTFMHPTRLQFLAIFLHHLVPWPSI